jgi:hypothetical protein
MITPPPKPSKPEQNPPAKPIKGKATQTILSILAISPQTKSWLFEQPEESPEEEKGTLPALSEDLPTKRTQDLFI